MTGDVETVRFSVDGPDGSDDFEVPRALVELLAEPDDDSLAQVVSDVAVMGFANRAHAIAHHGQDEVETDADLEAVEASALALFEERFGISFAEATGHSH